MAKWLYKTFQLINKYFLFLILGVYLLFTLSALLDPNHFLYNLEPYPDGLLYALSGKNFWLGRGLKLISPFGKLTNWTPSIYSLILGLGAFIFSIPASFYVTNIVINLITIVVFYWILKTTTNNPTTKIIGMISFLSHFIFFWLPSSPLTENISLLFFTTMIASFFIKNWKKHLLLGLSILGLLFTRYSIFPLIIGGIIAFLFIFFKKLNPRKKIIISFFSLGLFILALWLLSLKKIYLVSFSKTVLNNTSPWFGTRFIIPHIKTYLQMLNFSQGLFLWFNIGLTNFIFFGLFLASLFVLLKKKQWRKFWIISILFTARLPLQLVFYVADARYLIYSISLIILGLSWLIDALPKKRKLLINFSILGIILQLFLQRSFIRQVLANNLLGRSTAWQYEAVRHFNSVLKDEDLLVTALPPFFVDTYQTTNYRTLPLSNTQEFMNKKQYVWGNDLTYENLTTAYHQWLTEKKEIYISNAYITHHENVIKDFEKFKNEFKLKLVSKGCLQACNLYKLELKQ